MKQPNFYIIGAAKSGTTSLYHYLKDHPEVFLSETKELHYFDSDVTYQAGKESYFEHFDAAVGEIAVGEATPNYIRLPDIVIPRLKATIDNYEELKFIAILRNPTDRAWSHYLHRKRNLKEVRSFESAINEELVSKDEDSSEWNEYVRDGLYDRQLKNWFTEFDKSQFLILFTDDLQDNPKAVISEIYKFLGVSESHMSLDLNSVMNKSASTKGARLLYYMRVILRGPSKYFFTKQQRAVARKFVLNLFKTTTAEHLDSGLRQKLTAFYQPSIVNLEQMLDMDLSRWK